LAAIKKLREANEAEKKRIADEKAEAEKLAKEKEALAAAEALEKANAEKARLDAAEKENQAKNSAVEAERLRFEEEDAKRRAEINANFSGNSLAGAPSLTGSALPSVGGHKAGALKLFDDIDFEAGDSEEVRQEKE